MTKKDINIEYIGEQLRRTELLLEITRKIAGLKTLEEILWSLIDFVTNELGADRGTLFLNDKETNELYSRIAQGELVETIPTVLDEVPDMPGQTTERVGGFGSTGV